MNPINKASLREVATSAKEHGFITNDQFKRMTDGTVTLHDLHTAHSIAKFVDRCYCGSPYEEQLAHTLKKSLVTEMGKQGVLTTMVASQLEGYELIGRGALDAFQSLKSSLRLAGAVD